MNYQTVYGRAREELWKFMSTKARLVVIVSTNQKPVVRFLKDARERGLFQKDCSFVFFLLDGLAIHGNIDWAPFREAGVTEVCWSWIMSISFMVYANGTVP